MYYPFKKLGCAEREMGGKKVLTRGHGIFFFLFGQALGIMHTFVEKETFENKKLKRKERSG